MSTSVVPSETQNGSLLKLKNSYLSLAIPIPPLTAPKLPEVYQDVCNQPFAHVPPAAILFQPSRRPFKVRVPIEQSQKSSDKLSHDSESKEKNDLSLSTLVVLDYMAAILTSFAVAPSVAIIDKAIVANASGLTALGSGVFAGFRDLFSQPATFMKQPSVLLTAMVYVGTFGTANVVDSVCERWKRKSALPKFLASSTVNLGLSLWKDRAFTIWFSNVTPRPVPASTYGLYAFRDALTMAASFSLPPILSELIYDQASRDHTTSVTKAQADFCAQIMLPCAMQFVTTPIHLAAIDFYARPGGSLGQGKVAWSQRFNFVRKDYLKNVTTRMFRILPAFGLGGNVTKYFTILCLLKKINSNFQMNRELRGSLKEMARVTESIPKGAVAIPGVNFGLLI
ncbi:hypothetical protein HK096_005616 [Nowakowskiella sp. JEL0078]|nr:hypothetical protein HK096_005616 [Nowakowskiella sp. JEL0078]